MSYFAFFLSCSILFALPWSASSYTWPDYETDMLEAIYYQQNGYNGHRFGLFIRTCEYGNNLGPGRTNTAEWVRTAYHDMATADVEAGTGGIDASIGFERKRPENVGRAIYDTLLFFENFMSVRSSMADLLALGTVMSITACTVSPDQKPVYLPFRGGRIDATEPGPAGVPEPHQDLRTHRESFKKQGFNATEMIALVACGHSLGGVNGRDFPDIVPVKDDPMNLESKQNFDSTQSALDNAVATEFLNNSTQNALAFGPNETTRSDFRIFTSDGGALMRKLASSQSFFLETCSHLFQRMIDTVPKGVQLSGVITPISLKPDNIFIAISDSGNMTITGEIRIRTDDRPLPGSRQVLIHFTPAEASSPAIPAAVAVKLHENTTGYHPYSPTFEWWNFTMSAPISRRYSSFTVEVVDDGNSTVYSNGGNGFPVETDIIPQTRLSCGTVSFMRKDYTFNLTVAVRDDARFQQITMTVPLPLPQEGSMVPRFESYVQTMTKAETIQGTGYSLYTAKVHVPTDKVFVTIMSYGLSGSGGVRDVEMPFLLWRGIGSCDPVED
ncbi:Peroxidase [Madurella fahalii]|uniref:Peroxidase n=1 Tax=Madurella fahalii TaxID=1157608 RepID=A0ABQ0GI40_9PEZI